jgi:pseudaminic acid synthase
MNTIKIDGKTIDSKSGAYIIAEISANHNHDFNLAVETIKAAQKAGADAIKLQTYTADTITLNSNNKYFKINQGTIWDGTILYDLYKEAFTPWEWQPKLKKIANGLGMSCFSSPFDKTAVDFLEKMNVPAYKIASFEIVDIPLIEYVAKKMKPIIISTGIANKEDIDLAIKTCKEIGNNQIILLQCTSQYPTPLEEVNLLTMVDMAKKYKTIVGVSDHTMGLTVPIGSVALGGKVIEKHIILDRAMGGPDSSFSLEPSEFKKMVDEVRKMEVSLGKVNYDLTEKKRKSRKFARSLFIVENIKEGEIFTDKNIKSIRPNDGMHPKFYEKVLGKKANKNLKMGTPLNFKLISNE